MVVMDFIGTAFILHFDTIWLSNCNQLLSIVFVILNTSDIWLHLIKKKKKMESQVKDAWFNIDQFNDRS